MKIKILIGILILLIAINLGTLGSYLYVQFVKGDRAPDFERSPRPPFARPDRSEMRLDREQREKLRDLLGEIYRESMPLRKKLWDVEKHTFELLQQDPAPMEDIDKNLKEIADLRLGMIRIAISKMQKAKTFLTPEQQEHFFKAIMMARPGFGEPGRNMPPGPPHPDFDGNRKHFDSLKKGERDD
jgi:Spy/CpxP family protein refolding chaperone